MGNPSMIDTSVLQSNPFPGIRPYTSGEDRYFFGRKGASAEVIDLLKKNRFVALVGATASGKTSLIQSGIIPDLLKDEKQEWVPVTICPGLKPVESLFKGFQQVFPKKLKDAELDSLLSGSRTLSDLIVEKGLGSHNYFLVVDQFEDLFRPGPDAKPRGKSPETKRFIDLLVKAVDSERPAIHVLLSIRSDYIEESAAFRPLTELMNVSKYLLPQMSREALTESITGPVNLAGARFEPGFVDFLLEDLEDLDSPLPKLQHALKRTWDHWSAQEDRDQAISISDYQAIGTVESALSDHLEEAFSELSGLQKLTCERLFKSITSKSEHQSGFRRQATLSGIARIAHCSVEDLIDVVDVFRRPDRAFLHTSGKGELSGSSVIELSHESLIHIWKRLQQWVDEEDESIKMYLKLSDASAKYQQGRTELWVNPQLQLALEWRDSQKPTPAWGVQYHPAFERAMVFLKTSEEELIWEEERKIIQQKRRLFINRAIAIFMAVVVVVLGVVFIVSRNSGGTVPETEAASAQNIPESIEPAPDPRPARVDPVAPAGDETVERSENMVEQGNTTSLQEEVDEQPSPVVERPSPALRDEPAERQADPDPEPPARPAVSSARIISAATATASLSREIDENPELQGLLAFQSWKLNRDAGGNPYDREIYMGMYDAMKKLISPAYNMYQGIRSSVKDIQWLGRTGSMLIAGSDGSMKVLSGNYSGTASQINLQATGQQNECLLVSPDEKLAVVGTNGGGLLFIELENQGNVIQQNSEQGSIILFLSKLGNSGDFVAAGTENKIVKWDFQYGQPSVLINTHARLSALAASSNGRSICYATRDGKVFELNVSDPSRQTEIGDYGRTAPRAIAYSPSGRTVVLGLRDGNLKVLSGGARQVLTTLRGPQASITDLSFSPDGRFMAATSNDGNVYLWNPADWSEAPLVFDENNGFVLSVCFSGNSASFYTGSVDFPRLVGRPSEASGMTDNFCSLVDRNLSRDEWNEYFGSEIPYEESCPE